MAGSVAVSLREMEPRLAERDGYYHCNGKSKQKTRESTCFLQPQLFGIGRLGFVEAGDQLLGQLRAR
ncbi:MAG TPA: hypothetical protein VMY42_17505 [Thermoguttaceae bacterium]|nr:hypothetical protein [Thermoguttaceae bacterium]